MAASIVAIAGCGGRSPSPSDAGGGADADGGAPASDAAGDARDATFEVDDVNVDGGVARGSGCGKPLPANQMQTVVGKPTGYTHYTVMGTGATLAGPQPQKAGPRTFWVRVPQNYDSNKKYRTVYLAQGCGGYNGANNSTYQLYREDQGGTEQTIYVALDLPTDMVNTECYDTDSGGASQEWEAFELFHTVVDANYCVDDDNIFVAGFGSGAWVANMWGCYFAGDGQNPRNGVPGGDGGASDGGTAAMARQFAPKYHLRGQAGVTGGEPPNNPPCNGPVAAIWIHDLVTDPPIADDQAALARVLRMNGCEGSPTAPWHPEIAFVSPGRGVCDCLQYTGCPPEAPVVFCTTQGLGQSSNDGIAVPAFTLFFEQVSSSP